MIEWLYRRKACRDFLKVYSEELYKDVIPDVFEIGVLSLLNSFNKAIYTKKELNEIILDLKNKEYIRNPQYRTLQKLNNQNSNNLYEDDDKQFRKYYSNFSSKEDNVHPNWWWTLKDDEKENYERNYRKFNYKKQKDESCQTIDFNYDDYDSPYFENDYNNKMMYSSPNYRNEYYNINYKNNVNQNNKYNDVNNILDNWNNNLKSKTYNNQNFINNSLQNRMIMNKLTKGNMKNNDYYYENIQQKKNILNSNQQNENTSINNNQNVIINQPPKRKINYKITYDKELKPEKIEKNRKDNEKYTFYKGNIQVKSSNNNNNINQNYNINNNINFNSDVNIIQKIVKIPKDCFTLNIQGVIECAQFFTSDSIFCKYDIVYGPDWKVISGQTSGQSQHACIGGSAYNFFVWNFPFETSFYSNNPIGWPKLVISCFYPDFFGREKIKGYGVIHIPCREGVHFRNLQMFSPISGNIVADLIEFFKGQKAEIVNAPKVLNTGEGREIMKTESIGSLKVKFTIGMDNMKELGYEI